VTRWVRRRTYDQLLASRDRWRQAAVDWQHQHAQAQAEVDRLTVAVAELAWKNVQLAGLLEQAEMAESEDHGG
jgi:hypothetical protein